MQSINTRTTEMIESRSGHEHANAALYRASSTAEAAASVIELEPGRALTTQIDSAGEILLVMQGTIELVVNGERRVAGPGTVTAVPALTSHDIRNGGSLPARIIRYVPDRKLPPPSAP